MREQPTLEQLVLGDVLRKRAKTHRSMTFLKFREGNLTYGEVAAMSNRVAQGLASWGIQPGQHVAVMLPNCPEFLYSIFALSFLGSVAVPINTEYKGEALRHVLTTSHSTVLVIDASYVDRVLPLADQLPQLNRIIVRSAGDQHVALDCFKSPVGLWSNLLGAGTDRLNASVSFSDPQAIMFTSGTTGRSKGVIVPHALALTCAIDSLRFLDRWDKTVYCPLPLFHAAGLWDGVLSAMLAGQAIAIVDRFSASRFWDDVRRFKAQVALSVFSIIPILLNQPPSDKDKDHPLEMFYMGKSQMDQNLYKRFGVHAVETYTSTEIGIGTASPYGEWRPGSCGIAHAERFDVAVVDEWDRMVDPGVPGELVVRPKQPFTITPGYYNNSEATAQKFRNLWFHTGDRVWVDDQGYFYFVDRMADAIRRRGENISSFDIESEVNQHPDVMECAAFGVPSDLGEEDVKLAVVRRSQSQLDAPELLAYCQEVLPRFMVPRYIEFYDALPRTPTDKVAKYQLRRAGQQGITDCTWDREAHSPCVAPTMSILHNKEPL